jgi:hypothetical protein
MPVISDTFKISVADDAVIDLTASALDELTKISNLQPAVPSFVNVPRGLSEQLAEALDLIRASVPVAQASPIESAPTYLIQLSNDYRYLSSKLETVKVDVEWVDRSDCAHRFFTASGITLETFVVGQTSALAGLLDHTGGLTDTTNPNSYTQVQQAVQQVVTYIKNTAMELAVSTHCP